MNTSLAAAARCRAGRRRLTRGFTLVEALIGTMLMSLLLLGAMTLFIESQRATQRVSVQVQGSQDAGLGLQYVLGNAREAYQFALPSDPAPSDPSALTFAPPDGNVNNYIYAYQVNGANMTINTAIELQLPAAATSVKVQGGAATVGLNVLGSSSVISPAPPAYDRTGGGDLLWVYRGDALGNPVPATGQYLWSKRRPAGATNAAQDVNRVICKFLLTKHADGTPAFDAVQFVDKYTTGTDITSSTREMELKIVSGDVTAINGTQTNEATNGASVNQLYGKCALMRNFR